MIYLIHSQKVSLKTGKSNNLTKYTVRSHNTDNTKIAKKKKKLSNNTKLRYHGDASQLHG